MSFADIIKATRKKALMTQEDFSKEINTSVPSINRWENNRGKPSTSTMKRIKDFCERNNLPYDEIESEWIGISKDS